MEIDTHGDQHVNTAHSTEASRIPPAPIPISPRTTARSQKCRKRGRPCTREKSDEPLFTPPDRHVIKEVTPGDAKPYCVRRSPVQCVTASSRCLTRLRSQVDDYRLNTFLAVWNRSVTDKIIEATSRRSREWAEQRSKQPPISGQSEHASQLPSNHALSREEILRYCGVRLLMGQVCLSREKDYFEGTISGTMPVVPILQAIKGTMTYKRYRYIRSKLCCSNPEYEHDKKRGHLRTEWLAADVFGNSLKLYSPNRELTFDDQSFRYYGRFSHRMGPRGRRTGKSDPCAIGFDSLNDVDGFTMCLRMKGKASDASSSTPSNPLRHEDAPACTHNTPCDTLRTVKQITDMLDTALPDPRGYYLETDREYTTYKLMDELKGMGVLCNGTVNSNWLRKCASPELKQDIKQLTKGDIRCESVKGPHGRIYHTQFADKSVLHILSTRVRGYLAVKTGSHLVPVVKLLHDQHKGGVDLATRFLKRMNLYRRDKKWPLRVFIGILGLSVLNCMLINQQNGQDKGISWGQYTTELGLALCHHEDR